MECFFAQWGFSRGWKSNFLPTFTLRLVLWRIFILIFCLSLFNAAIFEKLLKVLFVFIKLTDYFLPTRLSTRFLLLILLLSFRDIFSLNIKPIFLSLFYLRFVQTPWSIYFVISILTLHLRLCFSQCSMLLSPSLRILLPSCIVSLHLYIEWIVPFLCSFWLKIIIG